MKIAGQDFLYEQNNRLRNMLSDFSSTKVNETVVPAQTGNSSVNISPVKEQGETTAASLTISREGESSGRIRETSQAFETTDFSTTKEDDKTEGTVAASSDASILGRYKFFVQPVQYQSDDGIVKRIFR